ncbi:OsmC family protein [Algoriphagus aquimarinus]|uniref:OsmC family protein n=1 Tax=Algoriphagus aquimarinus TaxID=237018 RepID=A0A5C7ABH5_9BACT|nr:OsmC family protein [Algoriphagus aquimarinus]TXE05918.1 OsmC family protein [Algoriphagus aquimarinus]
MKYSSKANSSSKDKASIKIKDSHIEFGITPASADLLPNPAELFLGSISACILKNVERFSSLMNFEYSHAEVTVTATRLEKPPRMDEISYELLVYSQDPSLNIKLLQKNIENFGTIVNTVKSSCSIRGEIKKMDGDLR